MMRCPTPKSCGLPRKMVAFWSRVTSELWVSIFAFVASHESPGVLLIPSTRSLGDVIDSLLFVWQNWTPDDLRNRVEWLPRQK